jgi:hypothetical protein
MGRNGYKKGRLLAEFALLNATSYSGEQFGHQPDYYYSAEAALVGGLRPMSIT